VVEQNARILGLCSYNGYHNYNNTHGDLVKEVSELTGFFKGFKKGMSNFGENIASIVNSILLSIVYIIGVGLTSLLARVFRKKFLDIKISEKTETYWTNFDMGKEQIEEYYKQF